MRTTTLSSTLLVFNSLTTAWPWAPSLPNVKALQSIEDFLIRRQNTVITSGSATASNIQEQSSPNPLGTDSPQSSPTVTATDGSPAPAFSSASITAIDSQASGPAASIAGSTQVSNTASNTNNGDNQTPAPTTLNSTPNNSNTTTTLAPINPQDPAGGIQMLTPAPTAGPTYYKIGGEPVNFVWNYTSLLRAPTAVDILATLAPIAGAVPPPAYTLALNYSFEPTQTFIWDTGAYTQNTQLPVGTYTLIIYDADASGGVSAIATPGYLGAYEQFAFSMYTGLPYTPLENQYVCVTCNAAGGKMERLTIGFLVGMAACSIGGFLWFAGGAGVL